VLRETIIAIALLHHDGKEVQELASVIEKAARAARVDPVALVALVEHESHFQTGAVSEDGEDFGLAQVRARFRPACKVLDSRECELEKLRLRTDPAYNLNVIAGVIKTAKKGKEWKRNPKIETWVSALAGTSSKHPKVWEVVRLYRHLKKAARSELGGRSTFRRRSSKKR
jgi:hypothetical protein